MRRAHLQPVYAPGPRGDEVPRLFAPAAASSVRKPALLGPRSGRRFCRCRRERGGGRGASPSLHRHTAPDPCGVSGRGGGLQGCRRRSTSRASARRLRRHRRRTDGRTRPRWSSARELGGGGLVAVHHDRLSGGGVRIRKGLSEILPSGAQLLVEQGRALIAVYEPDLEHVQPGVGIV